MLEIKELVFYGDYLMLLLSPSLIIMASLRIQWDFLSYLLIYWKILELPPSLQICLPGWIPAEPRGAALGASWWFFDQTKMHSINKQANKPAYLRINEVPDIDLKKQNPALACSLSSTASCCHVLAVPADPTVLHLLLSHSLATLQANKQTGIIRTEERFTLDIKWCLQ